MTRLIGARASPADAAAVEAVLAPGAAAEEVAVRDAMPRAGTCLVASRLWLATPVVLIGGAGRGAGALGRLVVSMAGQADWVRGGAGGA